MYATIITVVVLLLTYLLGLKRGTANTTTKVSGEVTVQKRQAAEAKSEASAAKVEAEAQEKKAEVAAEAVSNIFNLSSDNTARETTISEMRERISEARSAQSESIMFDIARNQARQAEELRK